MTHEHFFPKWLIEYADAREEGIAWPEKVGFEWQERTNVNPEKAVIPLCGDCNSALGIGLEGPVPIFFVDWIKEMASATSNPNYWCDGFGNLRASNGVSFATATIKCTRVVSP